MKRLINLRIALVAALCFILGIVSFREILFGDYYLLTGIVLACGLLVYSRKKDS